jgi:hypothetical protein
MGEVASVKNQIWLVDGGIDLVNGQLQGSVDISIRRPVEPDVAVADLNEGEIGSFAVAFLSAEALRTGYATGKRPYHGSAGPLHAFQKATPVYFVIEFEIHSCILCSFGCTNRCMAKLQAVIEIVFEYELGARRPAGQMEAE